MHSYHNKLLPNHFDEYFITLSSIHYHSTRLATIGVQGGGWVGAAALPVLKNFRAIQ